MPTTSSDVLLSAEEGAAVSALTLAQHTVTVSSSMLSWQPIDPSARKPAPGGSCKLADLLSCHAADSPPRLVLTSYPRKSGSDVARKLAEYHLPCASLELAQSAETTVRNAIVPELKAGPIRMLVLINPFGGGGKAPGVWRRLERLLAHTGLEFDVRATTHAGHAREMMRDLDVDAYAAVCPVSGDGLVYEIVNGLMERPDGREVLARFPVAPVPGGTSNALWRSICHRAGEPADQVGAAFVIARGVATPLDLWEYTRPAGQAGSAEGSAHIGYSFLSLAWGLVADVDLESEVLRCVGALRMVLYALWRILALRRYACTFEYLDAASDEWVTIEGTDMITLWMCNVAYMTETDMPAPQAEFDNGALDVIVVQGASRLDVISMFLKIDTGKHLGCSGVSMVRAKAFRLTPQPRTPERPGLLSLDGESVPFGPIEARALPRAMRVLVPGEGARDATWPAAPPLI